MKQKCKKCNIEKSLNSFNKNKNLKLGINYECRDCTKQKNKEYRENMSDLRKQQIKCRTNLYRKNNLSRFRQNSERFRKKNLHKDAERVAKRRSRIKSATFDLHKKEVQEIYKNRPKGYHVDHIVPLKGKNVSGLHVPWNLQYLPAKENLRNGNR